MISFKRPIRPLFFSLLGIVLLLGVQVIWVNRAYRMSRAGLVVSVEQAFNEARQKEQTYRIPVNNIINPGAVTIQSCGSEEILIIRKCPKPDTIVYSNQSGRSLETFINRAFSDLREHILPLNIYCLSDLFAGVLHDADMAVLFDIERVNVHTGEVLETAVSTNQKVRNGKPAIIIVSDLSDKELLRANLYFGPSVVLRRMGGTVVWTSCLLLLSVCCVVLWCRSIHRTKKAPVIQPPDITSSAKTPETPVHQGFKIGHYCFDAEKNELHGMGQTVALNKKENAILHALCAQLSNVVDRKKLLEENWGSSGVIYSRSLDTYITTLRKYLKDDPRVQIVTIKGLGYKLTVN